MVLFRAEISPTSGSRKKLLPSSSTPSAFRRFLPYLVLLFFLSLTFVVWRTWNTNNTEKEQRRFDYIAKQVTDDISTRLERYHLILRGGGEVFAASDKVTRKVWKDYVTYRNVNKRLPGIQGIGFAQVIQPSELKRHIQEIKAEGFPEYRVRPAGEREGYTSIIFLEPFDWRNQRAFGFDMFSEPVRRAAMERARDSGLAAISGKVKLVQESEKDVQTGLLMYIPIYQTGLPLNTVEERRSAL